MKLIKKYKEALSLSLQYVPAEGGNEHEEKEIKRIQELSKEIGEIELLRPRPDQAGEYGKVWDLLKEARDEADFENLRRVGEGIEIILELINHRCTEHRR